MILQPIKKVVIFPLISWALTLKFLQIHDNLQVNHFDFILLHLQVRLYLLTFLVVAIFGRHQTLISWILLDVWLGFNPHKQCRLNNFLYMLDSSIQCLLVLHHVIRIWCIQNIIFCSFFVPFWLFWFYGAWILFLNSLF